MNVTELAICWIRLKHHIVVTLLLETWYSFV